MRRYDSITNNTMQKVLNLQKKSTSGSANTDALLMVKYIYYISKELMASYSSRANATWNCTLPYEYGNLYHMDQVMLDWGIFDDLHNNLPRRSNFFPAFSPRHTAVIMDGKPLKRKLHISPMYNSSSLRSWNGFFHYELETDSGTVCTDSARFHHSNVIFSWH